MAKRTAWLFFLLIIFAMAAQAAASAQDWIGTWAASPQSPRAATHAVFSNQTIRQIVHVSIGGSSVRIRLSNETGTHPVVIGAATVGLAGNASNISPGSIKQVTFGGAKSITLLPGAPAISDPIDLAVAPLSDIAVSLYLPAPTNLETIHPIGLQTAYVSGAGDFTASTDFPTADSSNNRFFLTGIMVRPDAPSRAVVALGDSITDGLQSTANSNSRWPDILARRLKDAGQSVAVLNEGLAGNRVLSDGSGIAAIARFDRDVLSQPGVTHVILFIGANDIGFPGTAREPQGIIRTTDEIISGYKQLVERAHVRGIKVIGSPLTPFENAFAGTPDQAYFSAEKEMKRQAVNAWIRTSGVFDGLVDFEKVIANPAHPSAIAQAYDSGDHVHPNDAGYRAMAESIDLKLLQ